jgi:deoxyribodipyrimidine photo-lyase
MWLTTLRLRTQTAQQSGTLMPDRRAIVWMRRAIRLDDNAPLSHALEEAGEVIPLLVLREDPAYRVDTPRRRFIRGAIAELDASLRARGSFLHVRIGSPEVELPAAAREYGASSLYAARVHDTPGLKRDSEVATALKKSDTDVRLFTDRVLLESTEVRSRTGEPYRVFTPYKKRWLELAENIAPPFPEIKRIAPVPLATGSVQLQAVPGFKTTIPHSGESTAQDRLRKFLRAGVDAYADRRDLPGVDGTSRLSHHLALGTLSPRRLYSAVSDELRGLKGPNRRGLDTYLSELIWREFYHQIMAEFPYVQGTAFREEFRSIPWKRSVARFERWRSGTTGYPIVDAAMRQIEEEGWMHNRARMIVASFLTKDLHLNWQWGEEYFAAKLIDLDIASNNGGWQWSAGTGTDASPWFRIFNPVLQGKKFDANGAYVRRYVPELSGVPDRYIHEPWRMTRQDQLACGCVIGRDYPARIVDHAEARAVTFALYGNERRGRKRT